MYNNEIYGVERKDLKNIVSTPEEMQQISMQLNFMGYLTIFKKNGKFHICLAFNRTIKKYSKSLV